MRTANPPPTGTLPFFLAAAAADFLETHPERKISILDWDVHHGNGVADILAHEPRARYCSTHERGSFPQTGLNHMERGPLGNLLHLTLPTGSSGTTYLKRLRGEALPFLLGDFSPDVLLICAGYDALDNDPLAGLALHPDDFYTSVRAIVDEFGFPKERIALGLEGGYDLDAFAGLPGGLMRTCAALVEVTDQQVQVA